jgi:hypothetical protein
VFDQLTPASTARPIPSPPTVSRACACRSTPRAHLLTLCLPRWAPLRSSLSSAAESAGERQKPAGRAIKLNMAAYSRQTGAHDVVPPVEAVTPITAPSWPSTQPRCWGQDGERTLAWRRRHFASAPTFWCAAEQRLPAPTPCADNDIWPFRCAPIGRAEKSTQLVHILDNMQVCRTVGSRVTRCSESDLGSLLSALRSQAPRFLTASQSNPAPSRRNRAQAHCWAAPTAPLRTESCWPSMLELRAIARQRITAPQM